MNTIWCHLYGTDVKQDRFKLTVGDLDKIDVYDLKAMIIPHLASTAKQRPAFELRLYKVPTSAKDLPTFLDTVVAVEELIYPHEKVSKYLSREYLQEGLLHLVVIPVDCTSNVCDVLLLPEVFLFSARTIFA